eukprot:TRINITY_DN9078_c0_g1_i4.p1 TRINITY_DN9078_c0_g1~~TRINITY_DN9078_c0_g1_i4.p1  ORF type:complete len:848 (+),score=177.68 TRINITY_DN9078_c0_g1_i4:44-2587(+)
MEDQKIVGQILLGCEMERIHNMCVYLFEKNVKYTTLVQQPVQNTRLVYSSDSSDHSKQSSLSSSSQKEDVELSMHLKEIANLVKLNHEKDLKISTFEQKIEELNKELESIRNIIKQNESVKELKLQSSDTKNRRYQQYSSTPTFKEAIDLQDQVKSYEKAACQLNKQLKQKEADIEYLKEDQKRLVTENSQLQEKVNRLETLTNQDKSKELLQEISDVIKQVYPNGSIQTTDIPSLLTRMLTKRRSFSQDFSDLQKFQNSTDLSYSKVDVPSEGVSFNVDIRQELVNLHQRFEEALDTLEGLEAERDLLVSKLEQCEKEKEKIQEESDKNVQFLERKTLTLLTNQVTREEENNGLRQRVASLDKYCETLEQKKVELEACLEERTCELTSLLKEKGLEIEKLRNELVSMESAFSSHLTSIDTKECKLKQAETDLIEVKNELMKKQSSFEEERKGLNKKIENLESVITQFKGDANMWEQSFNSLEAQLKEANIRWKKGLEEREATEIAISIEKQNNLELQSRVVALLAEESRLTKERDFFKAEKAASDTNIQSLQNELIEQNKLIKDLQQKLQKNEINSLTGSMMKMSESMFMSTQLTSPKPERNQRTDVDFILLGMENLRLHDLKNELIEDNEMLLSRCEELEGLASNEQDRFKDELQQKLIEKERELSQAKAVETKYESLRKESEKVAQEVIRLTNKECKLQETIDSLTSAKVCLEERLALADLQIRATKEEKVELSAELKLRVEECNLLKEQLNESNSKLNQQDTCDFEQQTESPAENEQTKSLLAEELSEKRESIEILWSRIILLGLENNRLHTIRGECYQTLRKMAEELTTLKASASDAKDFEK